MSKQNLFMNNKQQQHKHSLFRKEKEIFSKIVWTKIISTSVSLFTTVCLSLSLSLSVCLSVAIAPKNYFQISNCHTFPATTTTSLLFSNSFWNMQPNLPCNINYKTMNFGLIKLKLSLILSPSLYLSVCVSLILFIHLSLSDTSLCWMYVRTFFPHLCEFP